MTKLEIISFVSNNLKKVDKTNKYHPVVIEKAITMAFNQGYNDVFDRDPRLLDNYTKSYGLDGSYVAITKSAEAGATQIYYTTLPADYVPFSDKNSGVRNVASPQVSVLKFYPASKKEFEILPNTLVGELNANDERVYYVVRNTELQYYGVTTAIATAGCRMDIVIPFDAYTDDEVVKIPFGKDIQLVSAVIELLRQIPSVDLKDNNADTE